MSYDLAVWEGPPPATTAAASAEYARRSEVLERVLDDPESVPPATPAIRAFVDAITERFPELDDESGDECPWASAPLISEAIGDFIYFPMTFSGATFARDVVAEIADSQGLVCYDPQIERLLPERAAAAVRGSWFQRLLGRG